MRSAQISFANKKVWIIGGGNQALKKGRQFIDEGADVTFVSPFVREEIVALVHDGVCHLIQSPYDIEVIREGFFVYGCTDSREINHQVVLDGNQKGMLSASVHKDADASYHPLQFVNYPNMHVAVSTNGASPAYNTEILEEFHKAYTATHHERLAQLREERDKRMHS